MVGGIHDCHAELEKIKLNSDITVALTAGSEAALDIHYQVSVQLSDYEFHHLTACFVFI